MADCKNLVHPFQNDPGVSQRQRTMDELLLGDAKIDTRTLADLLDYFVQFSKHINYYDASLNISDWQPFFKKSLPFTLSSIVKYDTASINEKFDLYNALFDKHPTEAGLQLSLYFIYYKTIRQINNWFKLVNDNGLTIENVFRKLISEKLKEPLKIFLCLMNAASKWYCIKKIDFTEIMNNEVWGLEITDLYANPDNCFQNKTVGKTKRLIALQSEIKNLFPPFLDAVKILSESCEMKRSMVQSLLPLKEELQKQHTPHLGLLFAFLKIFRKLQYDLNGYTRKHLDFFYTDVLKLKPKNSEPDKAHIIFELQNQLRKYVLKKGLLVKDGKDDNKEEILFALDDEIVVNKTQVAEVRTLFLNNQTVHENVYIEGVYMAPKADKADGIDKDFKDPGPKNYPTLGAKYSKYTEPEKIDFKPYPHARIGFILASPVLLLNEGTRKVEIILSCELDENCELIDSDNCKKNVKLIKTENFHTNVQTIFNTTYIYVSEDLIEVALKKGIKEEVTNLIRENFLKEVCINKIFYKNEATIKKDIWDTKIKKIPSLSDSDIVILNELFKPRSPFKVLFSGEKEWIEPKTPAAIVITNMVNNTFNIIISTDLEFDKPAVTFYNKETLKEDFNTTQPLVKIELDDNIKIDLENELINKLGLDSKLDDCCLDADINLSCRHISLYHFFRNVNIVAGTQIKVTVCGLLKNFIVQNDEGVQDVNSPFPAFGSRPKIDANFYIGCEEIFLKNWKDVWININWKDFPNSSATPFETYYNGYQDVHRNADFKSNEIKDYKFKVQFAYLQDGKWFYNINPGCNVLDAGLLFKKKPADPLSPTFCNENLYTHQFNIEPSIFTLPVPLPKPMEKSVYHGLKKLNADTRCCFLKLILKCQDFQHERYPIVLARQMAAFGKFPELVDGAVYYGTISDKQIVQLRYDELANTIIEALSKTNDKIRPIVEKLIEEIINEWGSEEFNAAIWKIIFGNVSHDPPPKNVDSDLFNKIQELIAILNAEKVKILDFKDKGVVIPKAPWTPIIQNISLDYIATAELEDIDLIHLYPYEDTYKHVEIQLKPSLFPAFCDEGTLFIALKDLEPGSNVNVLFQLAEASADSESERETLYWQYLSNNEWKDLRKGFEIIGDDETDGLTTSGVIKFEMPGNISTGNTIMPKDFYWIKASVVKNSTSVSETIGIHAQAVRATFTNDTANDKLRLSTPLAVSAISKLNVDDANINKVNQPYESFDGRVPELEGNYYLRVSELLRHKGRAIQKFDYERIALEAFPQLYKAKCINHSFALNAHQYINDFPMAPGYVILAVIPDLNKLKAGGSFEPKVPVSILEKITEHVHRRTSPFVRLRVMNPHYEKINFYLQVKLILGKDENYYKEKIKQDLREFLAPWAVGVYDKLSFGQKVNRSDIIGFFESKDYVDYIIELKMGHENEVIDETTITIYPKTPRSILIAGEIDVFIPEEDCEQWGVGTLCKEIIAITDYCKEKQ